MAALTMSPITATTTVVALSNNLDVEVEPKEGELLLNSFFFPEFYYSDINIPCFSSSSSSVHLLNNPLPLLPESFSIPSFDDDGDDDGLNLNYSHPKRLRPNNYNSKEEEESFILSYFDSFIPAVVPELFSPPPLLQKDDCYHEIPPPPPLPPHFNNGGHGEGGGGSLTAQTIAARERRRRITEKTQELGKLVPGGSRMNTAEMLSAAFEFVQFLKAQLGILQFMSSLHQEMKEEAEEAQMEKLQALLESQRVQERLYVEEKCLVLRHSLTLFISKHHTSHPSISDHLNQLLPSDG